MALEMRESCEKCTKKLPMNAKDALICSYECTFCAQCAESTSRICPNCGGELVRRPTRIPKS